jgi:hypothetical protein
MGHTSLRASLLGSSAPPPRPNFNVGWTKISQPRPQEPNFRWIEPIFHPAIAGRTQHPGERLGSPDEVKKRVGQIYLHYIHKDSPPPLALPKPPCR